MKALVLAICLAGCAYPETQTRTTDTRPSLAIRGAPAGSQLYVDGNAMGDPNVYDGQPNLLRVEPGTHLLEVRDAAGRTFFQQKVFVESETKTVEVH